MSFEIIQGDLFDPSHNFNALAQGVNTRGIMGSGIAVDFREKFPAMYEGYLDECSKHSSVLPGLLHTWYDEDGGVCVERPAVYNLFSQVHPGVGNASYELLERATYLMLQEAEDAMEVFKSYDELVPDLVPDLIDGQFRVGLPWIGCGVGGLKRYNVEHLFRRFLSDSEVEFVLVEQPER